MIRVAKYLCFFVICGVAWATAAATQLSPRPGETDLRTGPLPPLQPFNLTAVYEVSWGGVDVGDLVLHAREDNNQYNMRIQIKSSGLARLLTRHESATTVKGKKKGERYLPERFETNFKLRGDTRHIILTYNEQGELIEEYNQPPEKRWKRPEVPMSLKRDVPDIMTMLFIERHKIYDALKQEDDNFTIRTFDGRRLTDVHFNVSGRKTVTWNDQQADVIAFGVKREAIAGYKDSELEDMRKKKDPNVEFYLKDDGTLTPLKIVVEAEAGTFYANLSDYCEKLEACLKHLK